MNHFILQTVTHSVTGAYNYHFKMKSIQISSAAVNHNNILSNFPTLTHSTLWITGFSTSEPHTDGKIAHKREPGKLLHVNKTLSYGGKRLYKKASLKIIDEIRYEINNFTKVFKSLAEHPFFRPSLAYSTSRLSSLRLQDARFSPLPPQEGLRQVWERVWTHCHC